MGENNGLNNFFNPAHKDYYEYDPNSLTQTLHYTFRTTFETINNLLNEARLTKQSYVINAARCQKLLKKGVSELSTIIQKVEKQELPLEHEIKTENIKLFLEFVNGFVSKENEKPRKITQEEFQLIQDKFNKIFFKD